MLPSALGVPPSQPNVQPPLHNDRRTLSPHSSTPLKLTKEHQHRKKETTTTIFRPPHLVFKGICGPGGTPWFSPRLPLGAGKLTDTFLLLAFTFYWCLRASNKSNPISTYMRHKSSLANSYVPNE
ncbi:hypothetical protein J6590_059435 [Homalodisca vitripennis]|nr:hypothetical protein J6590_059435 [Homalodisca vitripennis]